MSEPTVFTLEIHAPGLSLPVPLPVPITHCGKCVGEVRALRVEGEILFVDVAFDGVTGEDCVLDYFWFAQSKATGALTVQARVLPWIAEAPELTADAPAVVEGKGDG